MAKASMTADEAHTKLDEFVPALEAMEAAKAEYESTRDPYISAKKEYSDAIDKVAALAKDIEEAFTGYELPPKPEPL